MLVLIAAALAAPPIDGTFAPSISQAEIQTRLDTAVAEASAQFNWLIRGIAKTRIEAQANACTTLKLYSDETHTGVKCDGDPVIMRLTDNSEGTFEKDGSTVDSVVRWTSNTLDIDWETSDAARRTHYVFHGDDSFDLVVSVHSESLTTPMTFTVPYRRTAPTSGLR